MAKLHQVLPVIRGAQEDAEKARRETRNVLKAEDPLTGLVRTYRSKDDDDKERLPGESKRVQLTVPEALAYTFQPWRRVLDLVFLRDKTNGDAVADLVLPNDTVLAKDVPGIYLLWLEKELDELYLFVSNLPRLDPAQNWEWDPTTGAYRGDAVETERSVKIPKAHVLYEATKEHPAQVQTYNEAKVVGFWTKQDFSGKIRAEDADEILARVRQLQEAVHYARGQANSVDVQAKEGIGRAVFDHVMAPVKTPAS